MSLKNKLICLKYFKKLKKLIIKKLRKILKSEIISISLTFYTLSPRFDNDIEKLNNLFK